MERVTIGEERLLDLVEQYVRERPESAPQIMERARQALLQRVQRDARRAADMETVALLLLSRLPRGRLRPADRTLLLDRLCPWYGATAFRWEADLARHGVDLAAEAQARKEDDPWGG